MAATPIADALQPLNVQMAAVIKNLQDMQAAMKVQSQQEQQLTKNIQQANQSSAQWSSVMGRLTSGFRESMTIFAFSINQVQDLVGRMGSQVGSMVAKYDPTSMKRFQLAADDLTATIGYSLRPLLERFTLLIRALADGFASLTGPGKALVAGLAAATVGFAAAAGAAVAFSTVINSALGGIPAILGAVVGGATGVAFVMKDLSEIQKTLSSVMGSFTVVMNTLGIAAGKLATAFAPLFDVFASVAEKLAGQFAGAVLNLLPTIDAIVPVIQQFIEALAEIGGNNLSAMAGVFGTLARLFGDVLPLITGVATQIATVQGIVLQFVATALQVAGIVLTPFAKLIGFIGGAFSYVAKMLQPIQGALNEVAMLFADLGAALQGVWDELGGIFLELLPAITTPLEMFARAIREVAAWIRTAVDELRDVLGLPRRTGQNSFQKGAGDGAAVRNVQTTSVQAMFDQAMKDAFSVGVSPEQETAKNTNQIKIKLEDIERILTEAVKQLPDAIGTAVGNRLSDAVKAVSPASRLTNGAGMGLGADLLQKMITG